MDICSRCGKDHRRGCRQQGSQAYVRRSFLSSRQQFLEQSLTKEEGAVWSIPGNEGRMAQAWVNVRRGMRVFYVYFWHSEDWTPRNEALMEAVVKQVRATRHPWLTACDTNMYPEDFKKRAFGSKAGTCSSRRQEKVLSTCRSKGPNGELIERTYDYGIASHSLRGKIKKWTWWKISNQDHTRRSLSL